MNASGDTCGIPHMLLLYLSAVQHLLTHAAQVVTEGREMAGSHLALLICMHSMVLPSCRYMLPCTTGHHLLHGQLDQIDLLSRMHPLF
jgi:hypothetical protein